jgi:hypothetical protein
MAAGCISPSVGIPLAIYHLIVVAIPKNESNSTMMFFNFIRYDKRVFTFKVGTLLRPPNLEIGAQE